MTELRLVSDDEIAAYQAMVEKEARTLVGLEGAEQDDLVQEGLIAVWKALEFNTFPSKLVIRGRMLNWIKVLGRQRRGEVSLDVLDI